MMIMNWNDLTREEKIDLLKKQIAKRKSASEIASMFRGATRNAVIGLCHRAKLRLPGKQKDATREGQQRANSHARRAAVKEVNAFRAASAEVSKKPTVVERIPEPTPIKVAPVPTIEPPEPVSEVEAAEPTPSEDEVTQPGPVSMMDLTNKHCRWPLNAGYRGVPVDKMMFCGEPPMTGSRYCAVCHGKGVELVTRSKAAKELREQWQT